MLVTVTPMNKFTTTRPVTRTNVKKKRTLIIPWGSGVSHASAE
jgi:hypothetical protein